MEPKASLLLWQGAQGRLQDIDTRIERTLKKLRTIRGKICNPVIGHRWLTYARAPLPCNVRNRVVSGLSAFRSEKLKTDA